MVFTNEYIGCWRGISLSCNCFTKFWIMFMIGWHDCLDSCWPYSFLFFFWNNQYLFLSVIYHCASIVIQLCNRTNPSCFFFLSTSCPFTCKFQISTLNVGPRYTETCNTNVHMYLRCSRPILWEYIKTMLLPIVEYVNIGDWHILAYQCFL